MSEHTHEAKYANNLWRLSSCQQCFYEQETTGIVYHRRSEWLIRSRPFLLEPVCFFIPHWDVHMPWHDPYLPPPPPPESLIRPRSSSTSEETLYDALPSRWDTTLLWGSTTQGTMLSWRQMFPFVLLHFTPFFTLIISRQCLFFFFSSLLPFVHNYQRGRWIITVNKK